MPAKYEPLGIKNNTTKTHTHNCGLYVLVYTGAQYIKRTPRSTAPYSSARAWPYTRAVHKTACSERCCSDIARPEKHRDFRPLKMDGWADGNPIAFWSRQLFISGALEVFLVPANLRSHVFGSRQIARSRRLPLWIDFNTTLALIITIWSRHFIISGVSWIDRL